MKNPEEIKKLANARLDEAEILCNNQKYDGAFYLAGYSIELMLKAKICERFGVDNLFDEKNNDPDISNVRNAVKTHDIKRLLIFSGLKNKLELAKSNNQTLWETSIYLFAEQKRCLWNEQVRYQIIGSQNEQNVIELIQLLKDENGLLKWIEQN